MLSRHAGMTIVLSAIIWLVPASLSANSLEQALRALKVDGRIIVMRHTQTVPGVGDPVGFKLGDCSTQRNLNELGIKQAREFGKALKAAGIRIGRVLVSEWCRSDDTARHILEAAGLVGMSRERFWPLNNVWADASRIDQQVAEVRAEIVKWRGPGALLMVSHGVTIRPMLGRTTSQGGLFIVEPTRNGYQIVAEGQM